MPKYTFNSICLPDFAFFIFILYNKKGLVKSIVKTKCSKFQIENKGIRRKAEQRRYKNDEHLMLMDFNIRSCVT